MKRTKEEKWKIITSNEYFEPQFTFEDYKETNINDKKDFKCKKCVVLDAFCYSDDTEVYVSNIEGSRHEDGWILFKDAIFNNGVKYYSPLNDLIIDKMNYTSKQFGSYKRVKNNVYIPKEPIMYNITLDNDTEICVTPNHSMRILNFDKLCIESKITTKIRINDFIPTMKEDLCNFEYHKVVQIEPILYKDRFVYCVTLESNSNDPNSKPNDHNLILRRKDKKGEYHTFISGNCGCGTTLAVASKLNRRFLGIDISPTACRVMAERIKYPIQDVIGLPLSAEEVEKLTGFEFQNAVIRLIDPTLKHIEIGNKGADGGIDGKYYGTLISVKKFKAGRMHLDEFVATIYRNKKKAGIFIALDYSSDFTKEASRLSREDGIEITKYTLQDLIDKKQLQFATDLNKFMNDKKEVEKNGKSN